MSLLDRLIVLAGSPVPLRTLLLRKLLTRFPVGSLEARLRVGALARPAYAFCLLHAARQAKALGHSAITAIEFGVAGGTGLLLLCDYRDQVERETGVKIHLIGLDAGTGLPVSADPRDLLYCWPAGSFEMDVPKLEQRLAGRARLLLGDVAQTVGALDIAPEAPIGALFFDLDYFSSTLAAFGVFTQPNILPRVWCYFDDISGTEDNGYTDAVGVRAAVRSFNDDLFPGGAHLGQAHVFAHSAIQQWHQQIYLYHRMTHKDYTRCLSDHKHLLELS